jgi:hypothetical protein
MRAWFYVVGSRTWGEPGTWRQMTSHLRSKSNEPHRAQQISQDYNGQAIIYSLSYQHTVSLFHQVFCLLLPVAQYFPQRHFWEHELALCPWLRATYSKYRKLTACGRMRFAISQSLKGGEFSCGVLRGWHGTSARRLGMRTCLTAGAYASRQSGLWSVET